MIGANIQIIGAIQLLSKLKAQEKNVKRGANTALMKVAHLIERGTKQKCPVKTGRLRASYTVKRLSDEVAEVGTNVNYAPFVEFGTSRMHAKPHLRPAVMEAQSKLGDIFKADIQTNLGK